MTIRGAAAGLAPSRSYAMMVGMVIGGFIDGDVGSKGDWPGRSARRRCGAATWKTRGS